MSSTNVATAAAVDKEASKKPTAATTVSVFSFRNSSRRNNRASAAAFFFSQKSQIADYENKLSLMNCSITIEKPDIILVEHLDDINTNAIILNVSEEFARRFNHTASR